MWIVTQSEAWHQYSASNNVVCPRVSTRLCQFRVDDCKLAIFLGKTIGARFRELMLPILQASTPKRSGWQCKDRFLGSLMPEKTTRGSALSCGLQLRVTSLIPCIAFRMERKSTADEFPSFLIPSPPFDCAIVSLGTLK